ncbi:MAG: outer membrane lipoprotein-sorting protein [Moritella dasanensis]|jgi:outer membrane lipoprotein-sorting protein
MHHNRFTFITLCIAVSFNAAGLANTDMNDKGKALAQLVDDRDLGYQDSVANMVMTITNSSGKSTIRKLELKLLETEGNNGGDKSLMKFSFPADIRGTALLTHPSVDSDDSQWLYLPSINRTKRISSRNKSGSFIGSEFSFEDLSDKSVDDFTYQYLGEQNCEFSIIDTIAKTNKTISGQCDKLARVPNDKHSGYSKQELLIDKEAQRIIAIDYYDVKGSLLKQMFSYNFRLYDGKYWRPDKIAVQNNQSGKSTALEYESITFGNKLTSSKFTRNALKK